MSTVQTRSESRLIAELNDLLQLDHDAVQAYTLAINGLRNNDHKRTLTEFRGDHERHIRELTSLIEAHGGVALQLAHIPTGGFKLAVQAVGNLGGDREILLAYKANERQVRDKYSRIADAQHPPDVSEILLRAAADERRHYKWAETVLQRMGAGPDTSTGRSEQMFETVHKQSADMAEGLERTIMVGAERARRSPLPAIAMAVAGLLLIRRFGR